VDCDDVGGVPRPFPRLDTFTKTMPSTLRFPTVCFAATGIDLRNVRALLLRLNRGDRRRLAFDNLQIVRR
jgi:hypothetical protein